MCELSNFSLAISIHFRAAPTTPPTSLTQRLFVNSQVAEQRLQRRNLPCVRRALVRPLGGMDHRSLSTGDSHIIFCIVSEF